METLWPKLWRNYEHVENRNAFIPPGDGPDSVYLSLRAVAEIIIHFSPPPQFKPLNLVFIVPPSDSA